MLSTSGQSNGGNGGNGFSNVVQAFQGAPCSQCRELCPSGYVPHFWRMFMSSIGVWPYQSKTSRCFAFFMYFLIAGSQLYFKIAFVGLVWPNVKTIVEVLTPIIINIISVTKVLNLLFNSSKIKIMLDEIMDSDCFSNSKEALIMQTYNKGAEKFAIVWACSVYITVLLWNALPLLSNIFGTLEEKTRELPVYYHTDIRDYYYPVYAHGFIAGYVFMNGVVATDIMYIFLVQRACGLYAIFGYRFQNALAEKGEYPHKYFGKYYGSDDMTYKCLSDCVKQHIKAIQFAERIESGHKYSFLLTVGLNMLVISCTGAQMVNNLGEIHLLIRHSTMIGCLMSQLFIDNYYAQRLMDHSLKIYDKILESNWYGTSLRTKKLLIFVITRSLKPSVLTIGGIHVMSMETFCLVLRCSASYFTILLSLR